MKQEIERHLQDKETLENSLPSSIVIGPYWISTEGVRQALAKKRKALANAVIELLAKKLRKQADMVCNILTVVNTYSVWGRVIFTILLIIYTSIYWRGWEKWKTWLLHFSFGKCWALEWIWFNDSRERTGTWPPAMVLECKPGGKLSERRILLSSI